MDLRRLFRSPGEGETFSRVLSYALHPSADEQDVRRLLRSLDDRELSDLRVAVRRPVSRSLVDRLLDLQGLAEEERQRRVPVASGRVSPVAG